jgi:hypothetical protein
MGHPTDIEYPGGFKKLAEDLGNLRYDVLNKFLNYLSSQIARDSIGDSLRKRVKLSARLHKASNLILYAAHEIEEAWKISAPYMKIWVIAGMQGKHITSYYVDNGEKGYAWVEKVEEATLFTKEEAEKHYDQLLSSIGRGSYGVFPLF